MLEVYRPKLDEFTKIVGHTRVLLDFSLCREKECNIGNLITESILYHRLKMLDTQGHSGHWTDCAIVLIQSGGIRASITKNIDGSITMNDVLTVLPFGNKFVLIEVHGKTIRNALEHSAKLYKTDSNGGFLQMHGVRVEYNVGNPVGKRVVNAYVLCADCDIPEFAPLDDEKKYKLITSVFLHEGGNNHVFREEGAVAPIDLLKVDNEMFTQFLQSRSFVYPGIEGRITFKT